MRVLSSPDVPSARSNTLGQMQEKEENLTEDIINLKQEVNMKLDTKVDNVAWKVP